VSEFIELPLQPTSASVIRSVIALRAGRETRVANDMSGEITPPARCRQEVLDFETTPG